MASRASAVPLPRPARWWRPPPAARASLLAILGLAALLAAGVGGGAIGWRGEELDGGCLALAALWAIGAALRHAGAERSATARLGAGTQLIVAFLALAMLASLASALLATSARPYADARLALIDRMLFPGVDWRRMVAAMQRHGGVLPLLTHVYGALQWEPPALLALFAATRREALGWRLLTGWSLALTACLAVFPWVPARGAYVHYGIDPAQLPSVGLHVAWTFLPLLDGLRDGTVAALGTGTLDGIVTMPSFHAAGAVVLGAAGWHVRRLRWPLAGLNAALLVSAVPIGGHYLVDVVAGAAIGCGAVLLAARSVRGACAAASA